jgi:3-deoxy-manno-octulosonate cytidylyltransferase (CMP-KDO synthetase)
VSAAPPRILAVVPVRMSATRLPGKPLLDLGGRSVVQRVHDAAVASGVFEEVLVATDDERIADAVRGFGGAVRMTSATHETGTDRVAEAALGTDCDVVANVQGDQPFVTTQMLQALVQPYRAGASPAMTTVGCPLRDLAQIDDPSVVKVVRALDGAALYFTRSPVPHGGTVDPALVLHHMGLYAFRRDFLTTYSGLAPTPLERLEKLEQLRVLEHGQRIQVSEVDHLALEINTPEDYKQAVALVTAGGAPWQS